ncbi:MAG: D-alanyl-D-alanine carboxypeptidase [Candidatus Dormibacteraeota bacterium]|nr:D-alanyl-D-alanine carboxypeptidase [Candidatus Dormibacteraeota bacterium]
MTMVVGVVHSKHRTGAGPQRPNRHAARGGARSRRVVLLTGLSVLIVAAEVITVQRLVRPLPRPTLTIQVPGSQVAFAGTPSPIPAPSVGGFVVASADGGELAAMDADKPRPIASVAKTMTAFVVLQAHPLQPDETGPDVTLTDADVASYQQALAEQGSAVAVRAGERLDERELLLALLLPSANNIADTLARWVSGSVAAFTDRENGVASSLGMRHTHFDDASGVSSSTVSSPRDLVLLDRAALAVPALADIVGTQAATLRDGTPLRNLDILLGRNGDWLGVKTGWTGDAGGCLLFAFRHTYATGTTPITFYGAVLGQGSDAAFDADHPELGAAFRAASAAAVAAESHFAAVDVASLTPSVNGTVSEPWGASTTVAATAVAGTIVAKAGAPMHLVVTMRSVTDVPEAGTPVADVRGSIDGNNVADWPLVTASPLAHPGLWWRLTRQ